MDGEEKYGNNDIEEMRLMKLSICEKGPESGTAPGAGSGSDPNPGPESGVAPGSDPGFVPSPGSGPESDPGPGFKAGREQGRRICMVLLGNAVYAVGVAAFIVPAGLITGGSTGLALFFEHWLHIPIAGFVFCFNGVMFLGGAAVLGKGFALSTLVSTVSYPAILVLVQRIPGIDGLTDNPLLAAIYAGGLIGLGIGIVLREGASTGGMDIPPLILNRIFALSVPMLLYLFDCAILALQMFHSTGEQVLYGILVVLIYTVVLDKVLLAGKRQTQVKIISREYETINKMIQTKLDRGSTLVRSVTGRCREEQLVVLSVISNRELPKLTRLAAEIDPQAFIVINQVSEVRGRGFTMKKRYEGRAEDRT